MNLEKIEKLITLMGSANIAELEIKDADTNIRISAHKNNNAPANANQDTYADAQTTTKQSTEIDKTDTQENALSNSHIIKSPMVGTFYAASSPDVPPFVKCGQQINKGDTVCILEAMKIMNQIESDFSGTIVEILVKDGDPVEFDQPIFVIN